MNNFSQFTFDTIGRNTKIVETISGSISSTKQFVWSQQERLEERDQSGSLLRVFYKQGEIFNSNDYSYSFDHLGSIRELLDSSGNVQAQYDYDPYGRTIRSQGTQEADFRYASYYVHARSNLACTFYRNYSFSIGRWLSRDPIRPNTFYDYVQGNPITLYDPLGAAAVPRQPSGIGIDFVFDVLNKYPKCCQTSYHWCIKHWQKQWYFIPLKTSQKEREDHCWKDLLECIKDYGFDPDKFRHDANEFDSLTPEEYAESREQMKARQAKLRQELLDAQDKLRNDMDDFNRSHP